MDLRYNLIWESRVPLWMGTLVTLRVAFWSLIVALTLGFLIWRLRDSDKSIISTPAFLYIQFFRGNALYVLMLWVFFGLPIVTGVSLPPFQTAVLCLGLLNSAYMSEAYRAAFLSVGKGQHDAAIALGLSERKTLLLVVIPQAIRVFVPAAANLFVDMLKDAAIVGIVGVFDLMRTAYRLMHYHMRPFEFYTAAGLIYFVMVFIFSRFSSALERRFSRHVLSESLP